MNDKLKQQADKYFSTLIPVIRIVFQYFCSHVNRSDYQQRQQQLCC
ncbi:MAG: hypothetical protein FNNCIFGK_02074 [Bacteroidia bacterium]|nr:MAG: hypothetical protein UZ10_BCD003000743 [Bacteroidetes bacterium OLB10]MBV6454804.1 hypothetical protein [Bacteroidia bacterium]